MKTFTNPMLRVLSLSLVTTAITILSSCNKDDGPTPGPDAILACKVTKIIDEDGEIVNVEYDSKDRITKMIDIEDGDDYSQVYEYDNNNRVIKISYFDGTQPDGSSTVEYNSNGQWTKMLATESGDTDTYLAEYDGNGNRTKITEKDQTNNTNYTTTFEYANGNVMKETRTSTVGGTPYTSTTAYEYYMDKEDKLKPLKELLSMGYTGTASKNMVKKATYTYSFGGSTSIDNYTYEYNDKGFPTKVTTIDNNSSDITSFEYQCK